MLSCLSFFSCTSPDDPNCTQEDLLTFANEHWDFKRWVENYYTWENYEKQYSESGLYSGDTVYIDGINFRSLFSVQIGENEFDYRHINEISHALYFYDPRFGEYVTFPDGSFGLSGDYFYCGDYDIINGSFACLEWTLNPVFKQLLDNGDIIVQKDIHYFENIGKYNHFFMGWEDAQLVVIDSLVLENGSAYIGEDITYWRVGSLYFDPTFDQDNFVYDEDTGEIKDISDTWNGQITAVKVTYTKASIFNNDGYYVAKSPDKWIYRDMREDYNDCNSGLF